MKVLIFDTETTGLPTSRTLAYQRKGVWPHIASISWLVLESDTNEIVSKKSYVVKPDGWDIPEESARIHGISTEFAEKTGSPLSEVMQHFMDEPRDAIVAHNLEFDENVVVNAMKWDLGISTFYGFNTPKYCTMNLSTEMCRLPSKYGRGNKPPRLSELYEHVFHEKPIIAQLHGSMYDAKILADILIASPVLREKIGLSVTRPENTNAAPKNRGSILYL